MYLWLSFVGQFFLKMYLTSVSLSFLICVDYLDHYFSTSELQNYLSKFTPLKIVIRQIPFHFQYINKLTTLKISLLKTILSEALSAYTMSMCSYW